MAGVRLPRFSRCAVTVIVALAALAVPLAQGANAVATPTTFQDFTYASVSSPPSADKPQSKLWFQDGSWWAIMLAPGGGIHIFELVNHAWRDTGTVVDTRNTSTGDALWDGTRVLIASRTASGSLLVVRVSYAPSTRRYTVDSGFPVTVATGGMESASIAKDSTGQLWVTWTQGSTVWVAHSAGTNQTSWTAGFHPPVSDTSVSADDISAIIAFSGKIGVFWSDQSSNADRFAIHADGGPDSAAGWTFETPVSGTRMADDHISLRFSPNDAQGRIFGLVKTSRGDVSSDPKTDPEILLIVRASNGTWTSKTFGTLTDNHTRPSLQIDDTNHQLLAFATAPTTPGGIIYYKATSMDSPSFSSGRGTPFVTASGVSLNNPSTTKQPINSTTGVVVLTGSTSGNRYYHAEMSLAGSTPPPDTTAPSVPQGVSASAPSATQVTVSWSASTDNVGVAGYTVRRNGTVLATTSATSFNDTTVSGSTTYSYTVDAFDAANNHSAESAAATVTTPAPPDTAAPTVPQGVSAAAASPTQVNLSWLSSTDNVGVTGYTIRRNGTVLTTTSATSFTDNTVVASTTYSYTVDAFDAANNHSAQSAAATVTTPAPADTAAPSVPQNVNATAVGANRVDVSWAASTDNVAVTGYTIRRDGTVLTTTSATSFSDTTVSGSTTYSYTVDAFDAANNHSAQSAAGAVTTPAAGDTTAPSIPQGVSASASSSSQVDVSWSASTDDVGVTGYTVRRNGTVLGTTSSTSYTDTTVAGSTTYSYTVDAFDAANNHSAQSAAASVTTPATPDGSAPSTPQGVTATASSATQVNVSWLPSTDNVGVTGYTVRRDGTVLGTTTSATSFSDTTVSASTTYSYTVDAFDAAGNHSPESNAAGVTTPAPSSGIAMRAASFAATTATTLVIPVPAGTQAGDVMLAVVADRGQPNVVAPSGWSNVRKDQNSTTMGQWIFVKVAGSAEPASYTFTLSASQAAAGGILSYTGVNTSSPIDTSGGQSNASSMAVTAPSITTSVPNALVVGFFGIASAATITAPAGMSERGEQASTAGSFKVDSEVADALQSAAGASGSKIAAATGSSANIGQLVALRPA